MNSLVLKALLPSLKSMIKNINIDLEIAIFKAKYSDKLNEGEFIGILETTELDTCEYIHIVAYSPELTFRVIDTMKVNDLITLLISGQ